VVSDLIRRLLLKPTTDTTAVSSNEALYMIKRPSNREIVAGTSVSKQASLTVAEMFYNRSIESFKWFQLAPYAAQENLFKQYEDINIIKDAGSLRMTSYVSDLGYFDADYVGSVRNFESWVPNGLITYPITYQICATVAEDAIATLTAPAGSKFTSVEFASYGTPSGTCGAFAIGGCHAAASKTIVEGYLLGQTGTVSIPATNAVFTDPCIGTPKQLKIQATASNTPTNY
jgi:hypothetical protein